MGKIKEQRERVLSLVAIAILVAIFLLGINIAESKKVIFGVKVAGINIGGKKPNEALILLSDSIKKFGGEKMVFEFPEKKFKKEFSVESLGIKINAEETIKEAFGYGRNENALFNYWRKTKSLFSKKEILLKYEIDKEKFDNIFNQNVSQTLENPARDATLIYNKRLGRFGILPSKNGTLIERKIMMTAISLMINNLKPAPIILSLVKNSPEVTIDEIQKAKEDAEKILTESPYILKYGDKNFSIIKDDAASFLDFQPTINDSSGNKILGTKPNYQTIKNYITELAPIINKEPQDAQFEIKNGKVAAFSLSSSGIRINVDKTANDLISNIWNAKKETEVIFDKILPKITENDIKNLEITSLIGRGISNFSGSPQNRIHNIKIGAEKIQGTLIAPNEEFSFVKNLGEVGPQTGYLEAFVIKNEKTTPEFGGGLCQVSTTLFRAAINAGLEITERFPHAYPVKYYNPQGFDATIYPPHPDLRFKNNTKNQILLQAKIDGTNLIFEIYGKNDGRKVVIEGPIEYDKKPDKSMKAKLIQKIYDKDGNIFLNKTFYSVYKSPDLYPIEKNPLE